MKLKRSSLKPTTGTALARRSPAALDPAYAPVDQRSCAHLMAFALDFSRLLNYYDATNQPVSNWSTFFTRDLSFLLARIVTTDFKREHFRIASLQEAVKQGRESTREILKAIDQMIKRIDDWYRWACDIAEKEGEDNRLRITLQSVIESDLKRYIGRHMEPLLRNLPSAPGEESWLGFWHRRETRLHPIWQRAQGDERNKAIARHANLMDGLMSTLRALHLANKKLQRVAQQYLEEFLAENSNHPPHTTLYIAFARLMELLQGKINTITGRHLDFYYRDVLKLSERGSSPDVVHISFELAPQIDGHRLPAETRLTAGKDPSGKTIEYATDEDLFINRARVSSLRALYLAYDHFGTSAKESQRVTGIFALPQANSADGLGAPLQKPAGGWPTFGVNETTHDRLDKSTLHAELGFIAASSALLLQEGERNVVVTLAFAGEGTLEAALKAYESCATEVLEVPVALEPLLADAFLVHLSGKKGWMPITQFSFRRSPVAPDALEIGFALQATDPAVVPNASLAPEAGDWDQWPLFRLTLNPSSRVYAYPFFKDLQIRSIKLKVSVRGAKKLQLRNELGLLDPAQPFPVFGPVPSQGSYLLLSHPELAVKSVDHATITVNWFNLPKPPSDMASHYAGYNLGINDDSFKVRLSVFGEEKWAAPPGGQDVFPLFARDYDFPTGLLPVTVIDAAMPALPRQTALRPAPQALTETEAPHNSIRLELADPVFGFGHRVFPAIMAEAAISSARADKSHPPKPLPNPPLAPVGKTLLLDYDAGDELFLDRPLPESQPARFCSLAPFGYLKHQGRLAGIFPHIEEQGHLYLGIADARPLQTMTLLFQICDTEFSPVPSLRHHNDESAPPLRWRYLAGHEWRDFPASLVLSDSTMGLTRSGIVKVSLPDDISSDSTRMPPGLCWLEVAASRVAGVYWSNVVSITTQAVTATRRCAPESDLSPLVLPAETISQLSEKLPQIKAVRQPFASSDGRKRETMTEFRTRVSERLRHKDRAIQALDFEQLVLDRFPEVGQVKCVGYNNSRYFPGTVPVSPGMLYLVVAPQPEDGAGDPEPRLPQFVLKEIEDFIRPHTSAFVKDIHAINPVYETLKVFANVEFNMETGGACYTDDLVEALSRHLQPWRNKLVKPMPIGSGQVQGYEVSLFIQQQPYVKRLHSLTMLHTFQTESGYQSRWLSVEQRAWASAPWAVLIPATQHGIVAVGPSGKNGIDEGIRNLTVGGDLVMNSRRTEQKKEDAGERRYFLVVPGHAAHWHRWD